MARAQGLQATGRWARASTTTSPPRTRRCTGAISARSCKPVVEVDSGDFVTIETLTHHANDDCERMVKGDPGAESVFYWDKKRKGVNRRGAGPMDASLFGRGAGEGLGVHICTGPVAVQGRRARRHPGGAHPRRDAAALRQPEVHGQGLRQQRRRLVGLPLQGPDRGAEAARGDHDLRGRRDRRARLGEGRLQLPLDAADRSVRRGPQDHRLSRRAGRSQHDQGELRRAEERARADPAALRRDGPRADGGRHRRLDPAELHRRQHRQLAHRQGRDDVLSGVGAGRAVLGRRSARVAGRLRAVRHGDRMLAHRHLPAHPAQEERRSTARRSRGSTIRCSRRQTEFVVHGFSFPNYLAELGAEGAVRDLRASRRSTSRCATPSARCATS